MDGSNIQKTFHDYEINFSTKEICNTFNYITPSNIQKMVLSNLHIQNDLILISQAGSGKTFAYLLCVLSQFDINISTLQGLIIVPTRELAFQTSSYFSKIKGINYKVIVGGVKQKNEKIDESTQIVIATIGKLYEEMIQKNKKQYFKNLKYLILDEADKLVTQNRGKFFEKILKTIKGINKQVRTILISATYDEKKETHVIYDKYLNKGYKILDNKESNNINSESSNIKEYFHIFKTDKRNTYYEQKYKTLFELLSKFSFKQALIFYNQKGKGEELASDLRDYGFKTTFIHGDLDQDQRILIYDKIKNLEVKLIVSTDLLSRGIDLSTIDFVINFDCPFTSIEYFHRVGRTGRYFSHGVSISFFQENELEILEEIKSKDELQKLKNIELDEEGCNMIKIHFDKIKQNNKITDDIKIQLDKMKEENKEIRDFVGNKRRSDMYQTESLISEWVDVDQELYEQKFFKYYEEDKVKKDCTKKFCLYCNFFKIFN